MNGTHGFSPVRLLDVQLAEPLPDISPMHADEARRYGRARVHVWLHAHLLGVVELELESEGMSAAALAGRIWQTLEYRIVDHLRADGLEPPARLQPEGIAGGDPRCERERLEFLAHARFVTVAIPTRDRAASLQMTLSSLLDLDYPRFEILVVDNAPRTRDTAELVASLPEGRVPVRYVREDLAGLSRAKNRGCREARGELVAFTDDDVIVNRHWLTALARAFGRGPQVACVTGMIVPMELETEAQDWIEQFGGFSKGFEPRLFDMQENRLPGALYPYSAGVFGSGANMAFDTAILRKLGGFDPALGAGSLAIGGEDLGICFDTVMAGYQIAYEPSAVVHHAHRRDYEGLRAQVRGYGIGLTAFLTKTVLDRPASAVALGVRLLPGVAYALNPRSGKNRKKLAEYPAELTREELKGMLYGPVAHIRARRQARRLDAMCSGRPGTLWVPSALDTGEGDGGRSEPSATAAAEAIAREGA